MSEFKDLLDMGKKLVWFKFKTFEDWIAIVNIES